MPGDVVVDVGTGTGLLAYFACQAGAARVFAIEEGPVVNLAREIATVNGFADRVEFFNDRSYRVELPERADVLISETLWNFGVGEGMVGFLADARLRFLKPGARAIPAGVDLHISPVQVDRVYAMLHNRPPDRHGIDFSPIRRCQVNNVQMPHLHSDNFLAAPALLLSTELDESAATDFDAQVTATITQHRHDARHLRLVSLPPDAHDRARQRAAVDHVELGACVLPPAQACSSWRPATRSRCGSSPPPRGRSGAGVPRRAAPA